MYLITSDSEATRAELMNRGVDVSEPFHFGPNGQASGPQDGNGIDQQIPTLVGVR